jgi:hypothetical protein
MRAFSTNCQTRSLKFRDVLDITLGMKLDRYKTHDIEIVDRMVVEDTLIMKTVNRKHQYRHESR